MIALFLLPIAAGFVVPMFDQVGKHSRMMKTADNARQIIIALKTYAADNGGVYPDANKDDPPQTANEAFRTLFVKGYLEEDDEMIFSAASSPFQPDGVIGAAPNFPKALEAGENHWALIKGLTDSAIGNAPLIFEAPNNGASWPPMWNADAAGQQAEGRTWKSGKIIIGRNDGSIAGEQLESTRGREVMLKPDPNGKDLFTQFMEQGEYLDVLRSVQPRTK